MDVNERNTLTKVPTALYTDIDHITLEFNRLMARIDELEREVCNWEERAGAAEDELSDYRTRYESVKDELDRLKLAAAQAVKAAQVPAATDK